MPTVDIMSLKKNISQAIVCHILNRYGENLTYANSILNATKKLLHKSLEEYKLPSDLSQQVAFQKSKDDDFQESLSKINEKEGRRKKEGVYYTDKDVTNFLAINTLLHYAVSSEHNVYSYNKAIKLIETLDKESKLKIISATTLDPTCGAGEFLLSVLSVKIRLYKNHDEIRYEDISCSIYGNDIESQSTDITKLRIFFLLVDSFTGILDVDRISDNLNNNFTNSDAIVYDRKIFGVKDIIIGNPPYVEYRNFVGESTFSYGNVYADVLHHSVDILHRNGIMAFVIPLSYISTIRMSKLRDYIKTNTDKQIVMNFADRPDSLFTCVHQKLSLVIAQRNSDFKGILTSSYTYWYKTERNTLFDNISLWKTDITNNSYWPKIGNKIDSSIYNKFLGLNGKDILNIDPGVEPAQIQINSRGCFWMKAFTKDMKSNSYINYAIPRDIHPFVYCLVNSSLFFLLWVIISDGWHITKKELSFIKFPADTGDSKQWQDLASRLEEELEKTKVYVGTKQVEYEYKHKACKNVIDEIDDELAKVYNLSIVQLEYIKNFALKYRLGDGA